MSGIINFETFLLAGILLNITPGNDTIFILTKSMAQGKKAGIMSVLGIGTGNIIHTLLAALGLSMIIAKSILLFNIIKYIGAVYLLYIGVKMFLIKSPIGANVSDTNQSVNYFNIYKAGVITNVLNPKVALFFIAFLPQFIDPNLANTFLPFITLGVVFTTTGTIWCFLLTVFASMIFSKLKKNSKISIYINKFCGTALIMLGLKVAFSRSR